MRAKAPVMSFLIVLRYFFVVFTLFYSHVLHIRHIFKLCSCFHMFLNTYFVIFWLLFPIPHLFTLTVILYTLYIIHRLLNLYLQVYTTHASSTTQASNTTHASIITGTSTFYVSESVSPRSRDWQSLLVRIHFFSAVGHTPVNLHSPLFLFLLLNTIFSVSRFSLDYTKFLSALFLVQERKSLFFLVVYSVITDLYAGLRVQVSAGECGSYPSTLPNGW